MNNKIYTIALKMQRGLKLTTEELEGLNAIKSDKENNTLFEEVDFVLSNSYRAEIGQDIDVDKEWETFKMRTSRTTKARSFRLVHVLSAAAAIALLVSLLFVFQNTAQQQVYVAGLNVEHITLPDSSIISLNKHSEIRLDRNFNKKNRKVILRGEAFFNVKHKEGLAFKVELENGTQVEVLGTQFNLRSYSGEAIIDLQVLEGTVAFGYQKDKPELIVEKGRKAEFNNLNKKFTSNHIANPHINQWQNGQFRFDNTPLNHIVESFERYYNKSIIYPTEKKELNYSGQFDNPVEKDFAKIIALAFGWEYHISETQIVFSHKK